MDLGREGVHEIKRPFHAKEKLSLRVRKRNKCLVNSLLLDTTWG